MRRSMMLFLLLLSLVLVACGGAEPAPTEEPEPTEEVAEEPAEEPAPTEAPEEEAAPTEEPAPTEEAAPTEEPEEEATATEEPEEEATPTEEPAEEEATAEESDAAMGEMGFLTDNNGLLTLAAPNCNYDGKFKSIEAVDELTVVFTMCKPDPAFPAKAAFEGFGIQPMEHFEATGGTGDLLENPVGTGPYMLDNWVRGDSIILKRNDDYWGEPALDETMVIRWATEGAARLVELQAGQVDQIAFVSPDDFGTVESDENLVLLPSANPNIFYFAMTNTFEPFGDVNVRKAIAMGIDRQRLVDNFYPEGSEVASHFTPCSIPGGCEGEEWYDFDPEAAKELLAEAGYPDGFSTKIYYRDVFRVYLPEPSIIAQDLQAQLKENLNIDAEVVVMESGEFIAESTAGNLEGFYLLGWGADYPHPTNFLDFHFGEANPQFGDPFPEIYEPLAKAAQLADAAEAAALYEEANNAIKELVPMVPIAHGAAADAASVDAKGAHVRPFGAIKGSIVDTPDDTFVFMGGAEPISLYCGDETDGETLRACGQIVESLLGYALDSGETVGALATSCDGNEDASVWTCNLREGVKFHDGSAFDSNDVVMSYAVGLDPTNPYHVGNTGAFEYFSYLWGLIEEGDEEAAAEEEEAAAEEEDAAAEEEDAAAEEEDAAEEDAPVGEMGSLQDNGDLLLLQAPNCDYEGKFKSIEAVDELTVVFTMCKPDPAFPAKAAFEGFGIQPSEHFEATGGTGELLEKPVGTGPYMLDNWVRGDSIILKRNDDYWGEPALDETMVIRWATEGAARLVELQAGQVDQIAFVSPDDFDAVESDENLVLLPSANPNIFYFAMTNTFEPFGDVNVRQAIAMGIDRQRLVDNFYPEGSEVASHFTPCSIPGGCEGEEWYDFDPEAAKELLAEAGYPDGFSTKIYYRDVFRVYLPEPSIIAQDLQAQLKENLNIDAEVVVMESGEFIAESTAGNLEGFYLLGWGADYPHPTNFLDFHFGEANLQFGDPFPEIYEPLAKAAQLADAKEAAALYEEANNAIKELVPMVPIAHGAAADAASVDAKGAHVRPFGAIKGSIVDTPDDTFVFMGGAEPISLYCGDETDGETLRACGQIVESLLAYELDSGDTVGALATSCDGNEDATVWTCNLREGVKFHDGSDFDANDVVMSYAVGLDAKNPYHVGNTGAFEYFSYLWGLMNVEESE